MSPDLMPPRNQRAKLFLSTEVSEELVATDRAHACGAHCCSNILKIPELRIMLYKGMANSMNKAGDFSGLFLASKAIYSEAETEIVNFRKKYIAAEELKWSGDWVG
ncbi:hypothetical protein E8E13_007436 [Curvularia kusanoi]|uniref:Uncharacterized protein n=1 Tax=Curvularia kusanoi TaxID=90978 RepID=A0A9P4WE97_CURKU|nr:hypothetical protein E8E13_007436 [Curvularia kusanoi]